MFWSVWIPFGVSAVISFIVFLCIFLVALLQKSEKEKSRATSPCDMDPAATEKMLQPRDPVHHETNPRSQDNQPGPENPLLPSAPPAEEVFSSYPQTGDLYPNVNRLELAKDS